jgi:hypothetical protein
MKSLFAIFAVVFVVGCANAQKLKEAQVPAPVVSSFHKMYPDLKDYQWNLEDGNYEAEYDVNKMEAAVSFDKNGNLIETEKEIAVKDLPAGCAAYVSKNYPGTTIKEASEITDAKGVKTYEAETKAGDLVFDTNGNFLKLEKD